MHGVQFVQTHDGVRSVQRRGQAEDTAENGPVVRVVEHVAHEALIYLEWCDREAFEVGQRRVAGAEIVEGKGNADFAAARAGPDGTTGAP